MLSFLHFCIDEKFNTHIVNRFSEVQFGNHEFVVCSDTVSDFKFENPQQKMKIISIAESLSLIKEYKFIIFHCITDTHLEIASQLKSYHTSCLISWGVSKYEMETLGHSIYEPITRKRLEAKLKDESSIKTRSYKFWANLPSWITETYFHLRTKQIHPNQIRNKAFSNFSFIATILPYEFEQFYSGKNLTKAEYLEFSYGNEIEYVSEFYGSDIRLGKNIMIGHSGFLFNNQMDAFQLLKDLNYSGEVIAPLSYARDRWSLTYKMGQNLFGKKFISPTYLPKEEYIEMVTSCNSLIMNNKIQQGMGNLYMAIYLGMKIYLNHSGMLLKYCQENDFLVYSFQEEFDVQSAIQPLKADEIKHNRNILTKVLGSDTVKKRTHLFLKKMSHKKNLG